MNTLILLAAVAAGPAIDPVVVTATRIETPVRDVLASVELIQGDDLLRQPASDLGDALRMIPGVEVVRLGGPGPADLAVHPRHGVQSRARAHRRPAHQSRASATRRSRTSRPSSSSASRSSRGRARRSTVRKRSAASSTSSRAAARRTAAASRPASAVTTRGAPASAPASAANAAMRPSGGSWLDSDGFPAGSRRYDRPRIREPVVHRGGPRASSPRSNSASAPGMRRARPNTRISGDAARSGFREFRVRAHAESCAVGVLGHAAHGRLRDR